MIGVLVTVLLQSSSTSTSIVITMVGSDMMTVKTAIPLIMGSNVGTSVTSTIVSFAQASDREEFRRAFTAATVHDMFNWLTVIVLLPIEATTGYLEKLTGTILGSFNWEQNKDLNQEFLKAITKPVTEAIIKLNNTVINGLAINDEQYFNSSMLRKCNNRNGEEIRCGYLVENFKLNDTLTGVVILVFSVILLLFCLFMIVKVLQSILQGQITNTINKLFNNEPKFPYSILVGYLALLIGCVMTILVQSSSVFTSALTPLAGIGVISIERLYPLALGSNLGTTTTGILAALAADASHLKLTLQIAFCHLFFNLTGILLYYPIPFLRFPIALAKILGETTSKYRWFSVFYLISMFIILPILIFALSIAGTTVFMAVFLPIIAIIIIIIIINILQRHNIKILPIFLRSWNWLPEPLRSLDPYDRLISKICCCCTRPKQSELPLTVMHSEQLNIITHKKSLPTYNNDGFNLSSTKF